jgi:dolichol-phosphate mannosyltransferase
LANALVIIPTYNEKDNISRMIDVVFSLSEPFHILIVDDNSPDGTANIVKELQNKYDKRLHLLERPGKQGLGTAYIAGFEWALNHDYEYIFEMDADFSHDPNDLLKLYECAAKGADMVIGSRYKSGVNVVNWPMGRVLMSFFASKYVRLVTGMKIHDATAGFICYRKNVLEAVNFDRIHFKGYAFQIEMKFNAWKHGFKIEEVPIVFTDRKVGVSKMSGGIFNEALWGVIIMKGRSLFRKYHQAK